MSKQTKKVQRLVKKAGQKKKGARKIPPKNKRSKTVSSRGGDMRNVIAKVAAQLAAKGHEPVLVGHSCAVFYSGSRAKVQVIEFYVKGFVVEDIQTAMGELGFTSKDGRSFSKEKCAFEIILYPPPLQVGDDIIEEAKNMQTSEGELKLLTPTDCVRNRLEAYYKWGDEEGLRDAVRVAKRHSVDMELVKRWSEWEWCSDKFLEFEKAV